MEGAEHTEQPRRFVPPPGYTQIPNVLFDEYLLECVGSEWQVLTLIARRTFGWGVEERVFTTEDLAAKTGLSRGAVSVALKGLIEKGMLARRHDKSNRWFYGIPVKKMDAVKKVSSSESEQPFPKSPGASNTRTTTTSETKSSVSESGQESDIADSDDPQLQQPPGLDVDSVIPEVFEAWRTGVGKSTASKLDTRRKIKLKARLHEAMDVDGNAQVKLEAGRAELLEAVAGMVNSEWHRENGHQNFDQLFRDRDAVDKFVSRRRAELMANSNGTAAPPRPPDTTRKNPELKGDDDG